jgi:hypothetical protein
MQPPRTMFLKEIQSATYAIINGFGAKHHPPEQQTPADVTQEYD